MIRKVAKHTGEAMIGAMCLVVAIELWHIGEIGVALLKERLQKR